MNEKLNTCRGIGRRALPLLALAAPAAMPARAQGARPATPSRGLVEGSRLSLIHI